MSVDEYFLRQASIFELRNIAREMGVLSPTIYKKDELIEKVLKIQNGEEKPQMPKSRQGRPPKSVFAPTPNPVLPATEKYISYKDIISKSEPKPKRYYMERARNYSEILANNEFNYGLGTTEEDRSENIRTGYYNIVDDEFGFVFDIGGGSDVDEVVFVPQNLVKGYTLKAGDVIEYKASYVQNSSAKFVYEIVSINNKNILLQDRVNFNKLEIDSNISEVSLGITKVDEKQDVLMAKHGTRNIVCIKNMNLVRSVIKRIQTLKDDYYIVNLLVDIMPEDIASLEYHSHIENFYTPVGESNRQNIQTINLAIERAKRLAEDGKKVIVIASEAKKIVKHKNFSLDYCAEDIKYKSLDMCYQILGLARRLKNGAEITTFLFLKQDQEISPFEKYLKDDFDSLSCNIINLY